MNLPYFTFKGVDSSNYLIVNRLPSIFKAAKDIEMIEVKGRDGFLTVDNGSYKPIVKTIECSVINLDDLDYICGWLSGSGDVIFSNEPDRVYKAVIINQIEIRKIIGTFHAFLIQFDCQPHKYTLTNDVITKTSSPATINNPGNASSRPVIKVNGTGTIVLTINGEAITLTEVDSWVTVDSYLMDCYKDSVLRNSKMNGDFPLLIPGNNTISWTGTVTSIEVTPNFRYL